MFIGDSIQEAIDWTQDQLKTTRPLAERTLFAMLADKKVHETKYGFIAEEFDEDELKKRHGKIAHGQNGGGRFHKSRSYAKKFHKLTEQHLFLQKMRHMQKLKDATHLNSVKFHHLDTGPPDMDDEMDMEIE